MAENSAERLPLLQGSISIQGTVRRSFVRLALAIGIAHAAVTTSLSLGTVVLGKTLGATAAATDRLMHGVGSLIVAPALILMWGSKSSVTVSICLFCITIACSCASFMRISSTITATAATDIPESGAMSEPEWVSTVAVVGAVLEGLGSALLWSAQGCYLGDCASAVVAANDRSEPSAGESGNRVDDPITNKAFARASTKLAADFGLWYLGLEVLLRVLMSVVMLSIQASTPHQRTYQLSVTTVYVMFLILCVIAVPVQHFNTIPVPELMRLGQGKGADAPDARTGHGRCCNACKCCALTWQIIQEMLRLLVRHDVRLLALLPFQVMYSLSDAVHAVYLNAHIASASLGVAQLGFLSAVLVGFASAVSPFFGRIGAKQGKHYVMILGLIALLIKGLVILAVSPEHLQRGGWAVLLPMYALQGCGRAVYETTNKAVIADWFQGSTEDSKRARTSAFGVAIFASGCSTSAGMLALKGLAGIQLRDTARRITFVCLALGVFQVVLGILRDRRRHRSPDGLLRARRMLKRGRSSRSFGQLHALVRGVNYEGGKIEAHAQRQPGCVATINAQIAMDAPFAGEVADEGLRAKGRSEEQFEGYNRARMLEQLGCVVEALLQRCAAAGASLVVVQVARGRSAAAMIEEIRSLLPPEEQGEEETGPGGREDSASSTSNVGQMRTRFYTGYRSTDYFTCTAVDAAATARGVEPRRFGFLNIGMFARLAGDAAPGEVFIPQTTWDVEARMSLTDSTTSTSSWPLPLHTVAQRAGPGAKSVAVPVLRGCDLLGLADDLPFVTPEHYTLAQLMALFDDNSGSECV